MRTRAPCEVGQEGLVLIQHQRVGVEQLRACNSIRTTWNVRIKYAAVGCWVVSDAACRAVRMYQSWQ